MKGNEIVLKLAELDFTEELVAYHKRNKDFLEHLTPKRENEFYSYEFQENVLKKNIEGIECGNNYYFYIFLRKTNLLIGNISLTNIVRGVFQSCFLGYALDKDYVNKGYMEYAIKETIKFAFDKLCLHRVEANVMPRNLPSLRVLEKNNFVNEGLSKKYLKINGKWEDHIHMVLINDKYV